MIDFAQAKKIATEYLRRIEGAVGEQLRLLPERTIEKPFGWAFFYNSVRYVETRDSMYMLAGNSPVIVDRDNGVLHETGTNRPIEEYIAEYQVRKMSRRRQD